ncbi:wd g-beta repeat-containing protein, partial [Cystoisospora suis]
MVRPPGLYVSLPFNADCLEVWSPQSFCWSGPLSPRKECDLFCPSCFRNQFSDVTEKKKLPAPTDAGCDTLGPPSNRLASPLRTPGNTIVGQDEIHSCRGLPVQPLTCPVLPHSREGAATESFAKREEESVAACGMWGVFGVGMYELVEAEERRRRGGLAFFRVRNRRTNQADGKADGVLTCEGDCVQEAVLNTVSQTSGLGETLLCEYSAPSSDLCLREVVLRGSQKEPGSSLCEEPACRLGCDGGAVPSPINDTMREQHVKTDGQEADGVTDWARNRENLLSNVAVEELGTFDVGAGLLDFRWLPAAHITPARIGVDESSRPLSATSSCRCSSVVAAVGSDRALHVLVVHPGSPESTGEKGRQANKCQVTQAACVLLLPQELEKECGDVIGVAVDSFMDDGRLVAACCSNGYASIVKDLEFVDLSWKAHDIETWCIVFDPHSRGNVLATGADDCTVCLWDIRCGFGNKGSKCGGLAAEETGVSATCSFRNHRSHSMGVTAATFCCSDPHLILTGSYDENVRVFDRRQLHTAVDSFKVSGGVWRLKWSSFPSGNAEDRLLLVAACHGGCEVWKASPGGQGFKRLAHFSGHESMAYGIAALPVCAGATAGSLAA